MRQSPVDRLPQAIPYRERKLVEPDTKSFLLQALRERTNKRLFILVGMAYKYIPLMMSGQCVGLRIPCSGLSKVAFDFRDHVLPTRIYSASIGNAEGIAKMGPLPFLGH